MRSLIISIILIFLYSCSEDVHPIPKSISFGQCYKYLFSLKKINSSLALDTLAKISDTILQNSSISSSDRKGTVYKNRSDDSKFLIYEYSSGNISAIVYYKGSHLINIREYYPNGQTICAFNVSVEGVRDGNYICYYENGVPKFEGFYSNGKAVPDSIKYFDIKKIITEQVTAANNGAIAAGL